MAVLSFPACLALAGVISIMMEDTSSFGFSEIIFGVFISVAYLWFVESKREEETMASGRMTTKSYIAPTANNSKAIDDDIARLQAEAEAQAEEEAIRIRELKKLKEAQEEEEEEKKKRAQAEAELLAQKQAELKAQEEEQRVRKELEAKAEQEAQEQLRLKELEEARLQAEAEQAARFKEEEEAKERALEAERLQKEQEEAARIQAEAEQAAEEQLRLKQLEEARLQAEAEQAARVKEEQEAKERALEAERLEKEQEEAARLQAEAEEAARLQAELEEESRKQAEAEAKRQAEEEAARIKAQEEEERRLQEIEDARAQAEKEQAARLQAEAESKAKAEEEEAARQAAEEQERALAEQKLKDEAEESVEFTAEKSEELSIAPPSSPSKAPSRSSLETAFHGSMGYLGNTDAAANSSMSMRVRVLNETTGRSKDVIVPVTPDLTVEEAVYSNHKVREAGVRKWPKELAQAVKQKTAEVVCLLLNPNTTNVMHTYSIADMKETSTEAMHELAAPEWDQTVRILLKCQSIVIEEDEDETEQPLRDSDLAGVEHAGKEDFDKSGLFSIGSGDDSLSLANNDAEPKENVDQGTPTTVDAAVSEDAENDNTEEPLKEAQSEGSNSPKGGGGNDSVDGDGAQSVSDGSTYSSKSITEKKRRKRELEAKRLSLASPTAEAKPAVEGGGGFLSRFFARQENPENSPARAT